MKLEIVFKDGRKETYDGVASFNAIDEQITNKVFDPLGVSDIQTEGKLFEVNPLEIDRSKFEKPKRKWRHEFVRDWIRRAFLYVDKYPEKHASVFYTMIPEKKWNGYKSVAEFEEYANDLGGLIADWVEQALEWAQRISYGESWESICSDADTKKWYRMIAWDERTYQRIGGSRLSSRNFPSSYVHDKDYYLRSRIRNTVPLIVIKKK